MIHDLIDLYSVFLQEQHLPAQCASELLIDSTVTLTDEQRAWLEAYVDLWEADEVLE